uniref:Transmembrane 9 superfamily member n=1 Tax=Helianthus annuus TaxID=4232 RepID=A0A251TWI9_HELAN
MSVIRWLTVALLLAFCTNKVHSDASDHKYKPADEVPIYANKVGPFHNPSETYRYYDLPFCLPARLKEKPEALGEVLNGDRLVSAPYKLETSWSKRLENRLQKNHLQKTKVIINSEKPLPKDLLFQMYYDDLPFWGF